jgi:hypothetical protein
LRQLNVGGAMAAGKWTMLTGTWDGVTQKLYKDGVVVASQAPGGTLSDAASGLFLASASEPLVGALDEVRLYNRPLSDAEVQKLFADGSAGTIGDAVPATPATSGKPWKALFDGTTLGFLKHNGNGWKVEDGAVMPVPGVDDAAQTKEQFTDGELRIRFEVKDADRVSFTLRQGGEGGYGIDITRELKALEGKPHELIVIANGDQVTATLDGKPIPVSANGAPKSGHLQFTARGKSIRLLSFEIR